MDNKAPEDKTPGKPDAIMMALAIAAIIMLILITAAAVFVDFPKANEGLIYMLAGGLLGNVNQVFNFIFGSSKGSKDKTQALADELAQDEA